MAALWKRAGHYIFVPCSFFFYLLSFSSPKSQPSQIGCLPYFHMALVRIYDAGLKHAARGSLKIQDAKVAKNRHLAPSHNFVGLYLRKKANIGNRKKFVKQQYLRHCLGVITAPTSLTGGQPNFARCLAVSRAGTLNIHFRWLLPPGRILRGAKFTLRPSIACSCIGSVTERHSSSGRQPNFAAWYKRNGIVELSHRTPPKFGPAAITLGIGTYSNNFL